MNATERLHDLGQSLWLDNITRDLLSTGAVKHNIDELAVTGLTSNPTIFNHAIKNSAGIDIDALAAQLQDEGAKSFEKSWDELMAVIASKSAALAKAS